MNKFLIGLIAAGLLSACSQQDFQDISQSAGELTGSVVDGASGLYHSAVGGVSDGYQSVRQSNGVKESSVSTQEEGGSSALSNHSPVNVRKKNAAGQNKESELDDFYY